jgi:hypothetical protein
LLVAVAVSVGNVLLSRNTDIYFVGWACHWRVHQGV